MKVDPNNTFAIVVGIERYAIPDSDLSGPASDGIRFVRWLLGNGVPADNILFFATPLPKNYDALKAEQGAAAVEAITDDVRKALLKPGFKGAPNEALESLLYFFWSGHGVSNAKDNQCLVCSDAEIEDPRVFNLEDVRRRLRTKTWAGFQNQVFVVDACATYYEPQFSTTLSPIDLPVADQEIDDYCRPRQFVIVAAPPGQTTSNDSLNEIGGFSELFLDALDRTPRDGLLVNMDQLSAIINDSYERLKSEGKLPPELTPRVNLVNWGGSSFPLHLAMRKGESTKDVELKRKVFEKLCTLQVNLNELYILYLKLVDRPSQHQTVAGMVADLSELPAHGMPRLLEFVARIAFHCEQPELDAWLDDLFRTEKLELPALLTLREELEEEGKPFQPPFYLFINVPSYAPHRITYWLFDQAGKLIYKPEERDEIEIQPTREGVKQAVDTILRNNALAYFIDDLHVELFVSDKLLMIEADQWCNPHDEDYTLGASYRVALRWRDRAEGTAAVPAQRWKRIAAIIRDQSFRCPTICWTAPDESTEKFSFEEWKNQANLHACVGFSFNPIAEMTGELNPLLRKALKQGIPFAFWVRQCPDDWDTFRKLLDDEVRGGDLEQTPERLRRLRRKESESMLTASRFLSVLWDDPLRNPFEYDPKSRRTFTGAHLQLTDIA